MKAFILIAIMISTYLSASDTNTTHAYYYKGENLKSHETANQDGSTTSYDVSGKQTIDKDDNLQKGGKSGSNKLLDLTQFYF